MMSDLEDAMRVTERHCRAEGNPVPGRRARDQPAAGGDPAALPPPAWDGGQPPALEPKSAAIA
eukprot:9501191-Pyramimonas_sp.AAC.1